MTPALSAAVEFANHWAEIWWRQVFHGTWQAAAVAAVLLMVVRLTSRWPAPVRYGLLLLALAKFLFPPLASLPTGVFSQATLAVALPAEPPASLTPGPRAWNQSPGISGPGLGSDATLVGPGKPSAWRSGGAALSWRAWLMMVHLAGAMLLLGALLRQALVLHSLVRDSYCCTGPGPAEWLDSRRRQLHMQQPVALRISNTVDSPLSFGMLRPTILLPASVLELPRPDLETIVVHELAHLRRGDAWTSWLQVLACALWWFHPLVWMTARALRHIREECCDDLLLLSGVTSQAGYCDTLLRVAAQFPRTSPGALACGMAQHLHPLAFRLTRILDPRTRRLAQMPRGAAVAVALLAATLLPGLTLVDSAESAGRELPGGGRTNIANHSQHGLPRSTEIAPTHFAGQKESAGGVEDAAPSANISSPPAPVALDLSGDWLLTLPAGFEYRVRFESRGEHDYYLVAPGMAFRGVYRWHGSRLEMANPDDPRMGDYVWTRESPHGLRLVEPLLAKNGGRYAGAFLTRVGVPLALAAGHTSQGSPGKVGPGSGDPATPGKMHELGGNWRLTLPAGFVCDVTLRPAQVGGYWLEPKRLMCSGLYQVRGDQLVLVMPREPRLAGFAWNIAAAGQLELVGQPPTAATGANYLGATLTRDPQEP